MEWIKRRLEDKELRRLSDDIKCHTQQLTILRLALSTASVLALTVSDNPR